LKCEYCDGAIIYKLGNSVEPGRTVCMACGREPKLETEVMSNQLDYGREEKVKALLKTHSIREITKETGVAKNTIARIRNENLTDEEKIELKKIVNVKGRNKRELEKEKPKGKEEKMEEETKVCSKCNLPKSLDEFNKNKSISDGLEYHCRECKKKQAAAYRKKKKPGKDFPKGGRSDVKAIAKGKRKKQKTGDSKPVPQTVAEGILLDQQLIKAIKRSVAKEIVGIIEERFA